MRSQASLIFSVNYKLVLQQNHLYFFFQYLLFYYLVNFLSSFSCVLLLCHYFPLVIYLYFFAFDSVEVTLDDEINYV